MASQLLQKEAEFHKLNKELEIRTQALLLEVDSVMKSQESLKSSKSHCTFPSSYTPVDNVDEKLVAKTEQILDDACDFLPEASKHMGLQGMTRFLKAKVRKLQEEVNTIQTDYKKKCNIIKTIQAENKLLSDDRSKFMQQLTASREHTTKQDEQVSVLSSRLQTKETENNCLRKEVDSLKKEMKTLTAASANSELRLNKALEDVDKLKGAVKQMKHDDKEYRDASQNQIQEMTSTIKRLEKLKTELGNAFKKQTLLVDNLKRQKMQLEASRMLQITEEEFVKILDWNIPEKKIP